MSAVLVAGLCGEGADTADADDVGGGGCGAAAPSKTYSIPSVSQNISFQNMLEYFVVKLCNSFNYNNQLQT